MRTQLGEYAAQGLAAVHRSATTLSSEVRRIWYLVLSRALRSRDESAPRRPAHLDWLLDLHRSGGCLFSGPSSDHAVGVYVLLAPGLEAARRIAAGDPFHQHGDRQAEVIEWNVQRALRLGESGVEQLTRLAAAGEGPA